MLRTENSDEYEMVARVLNNIMIQHNTTINWLLKNATASKMALVVISWC